MHYKYVKNPDKLFSQVVKNIFDNKNLFGEEQSIYQTNFLIDLLNINKKSIIIDLGSHEGQELSQLVKSGCKVHAFEPNIHCFQILKKKFQSLNNFILNNSAASNKDQEEYFYFLKKNKKSITKDSGSLLATNYFVHSKNVFKKQILTFYYKFFL